MTESLPQQMYLLCYDPDKGKIELASAGTRDVLLRAAAAGQMTIGGLLRDHNGKAERTTAAATTSEDPFLAEVLGDVPGDRPRRWFTVVYPGRYTAEATIRGQLAEAGAITDDSDRVLRLIPVHHITLADPQHLHILQDRIGKAVLGGQDPASLSIEDAVLAVLAVEGGVSTLFGLKDRFTHRDTIRELSAHVDSQLPGLRKAVTLAVARTRATVIS